MMKWLLPIVILLLGMVLLIGTVVTQIIRETVVAQRTSPPAKEPVSLSGVKWPLQIAEKFLDGPTKFPEATRIFYMKAAQRVPLSKVVNLTVFGDFRPGFSFDEAVARYGKPSRVRTNQAGRAAIYDFPSVRIEVEHNVYDSGWFAEYHYKSVYAYPKPDNVCTPAQTILDASINIFIPKNSSVELHVSDAEENEQHVFVLVTDGCIKAMNWFVTS